MQQWFSSSCKNDTCMHCAPCVRVHLQRNDLLLACLQRVSQVLCALHLHLLLTSQLPDHCIKMINLRQINTRRTAWGRQATQSALGKLKTRKVNGVVQAVVGVAIRRDAAATASASISSCKHSRHKFDADQCCKNIPSPKYLSREAARME